MAQRIIAICFALVVGFGLLICFAAADPYMGIGHEVVEDPAGLLVTVSPGSPSALSGLKTGDLIIEIDGVVLAGTSLPFAEVLKAAIASRIVGDALPLLIYRDAAQFVLTVDGRQVVVDFPQLEFPSYSEEAEIGELVALTSRRVEREIPITVILGARPGSTGEPFAPNSELACDVADTHPEVRELLSQLVEEMNVPMDTADLYQRLNNRASPDDGFRLSRLVYLLRDGLKGEAVTREISARVSREALLGVGGYYVIQDIAAELLDENITSWVPPARLETALSAEAHLDRLELVLITASVQVKAAFADFSEDELAFIAKQRVELSEVFRQGNYIESEDDNPRRVANNIKLIEMAKRVDYSSLLQAQATLAVIADERFLGGLKADLLSEFAGRLSESDLLVRETPLGKLVISGTGHTWRQGEGAALLIDLGGDDFYTTNAGSGFSLDRPVGVLIEFGGDDAYESSKLFSQGSGSLGVGLLIDVAGDDQYIGLQWAQGTGFFGCGAILDLAGDDVYRGEEFCQGVGIFGSGLVVDYSGDDRMEGQMKCQGFGGAKGIGLIVDVSGNDYRYAKGKYPTGYGDAGIFDAWSQGCAQGFRGYASGGIAGIIDLAGEDYYEAGNFSQGGGYYFGYGFIHDLGGEDDVYIGSRYNQGFSAHQAVGVFLEEGGDDLYHTRQAVAQGLAWDECCTIFIDYDGDDTYQGGGGFSQGASAHNSICLMWDRAGRDTYEYAPGQARAGGNDYHGGTSLSLFIDEGGDIDWYSSERSSNGLLTGWPEHGFFVDLNGNIADSLANESWRELWQTTSSD